MAIPSDTTNSSQSGNGSDSAIHSQHTGSLNQFNVAWDKTVRSNTATSDIFFSLLGQIDNSTDSNTTDLEGLKRFIELKETMELPQEQRSLLARIKNEANSRFDVQRKGSSESAVFEESSRISERVLITSEEAKIDFNNLPQNNLSFSEKFEALQKRAKKDSNGSYELEIINVPTVKEGTMGSMKLVISQQSIVQGGELDTQLKDSAYRASLQETANQAHWVFEFYDLQRPEFKLPDHLESLQKFLGKIG